MRFPTDGTRIAILFAPTLLAYPCFAQAEPAETDTSSSPPANSAPASAGDSASLAKQLANPISSLISVPFQQNLDFGLGPDGDGMKATLNIQPVIPVSLNEDWNVIVRTILPISYQDSDVAGDDAFGLGDVLQSFFFSPKRPGKSGITWGVGPVILYPTATDKLLGGQKWGAGPTVVLLKQDSGWTFGMLANHIWSFAGKDSRADISQTFLQPFVSYTWPNTVGISVNTEASYNWETEKWLVPINLGASKVVRLGQQRASIQGGVRYYASGPDGSPNWGFRMSFTLLFPRR